MYVCVCVEYAGFMYAGICISRSHLLRLLACLCRNVFSTRRNSITCIGCQIFQCHLNGNFAQAREEYVALKIFPKFIPKPLFTCILRIVDFFSFFAIFVAEFPYKSIKMSRFPGRSSNRAHSNSFLANPRSHRQ